MDQHQVDAGRDLLAPGCAVIVNANPPMSVEAWAAMGLGGEQRCKT